MSHSFRNTQMKTALKCAGVFVVATVVGTGMAAADPKKKDVMLDNGLPVNVRVKYEGDAEMARGNYGYKAGATNLLLGRIPEGTTLKWVAIPEPNEPDQVAKSTFTKCTGSWTISSSTSKVVLNSAGCDHKTPKAAAAADIEVTLTNNLGENVSIWVSGTDDQISGRPAPAGFSHTVGKAHEGAKVTWAARSSTQDCSGEIQVSSSSKAISIDGNKCKVKAGPVHHGNVTTWQVGVTNDGPDKIEVHIADLFDDKRSDLDFKAVKLDPGGSGTVELIPVNGEAHAGVEVKDDNRFCGDERLVVIKPGNSIHVTEQGQRVIRECKITKR